MTKISPLKTYEDDRGCLLPLEFNNLPFTPKRIFVVNNVPKNSIRGNHAHYKTKQILICLNGYIEVILKDGINESITQLKKNEQILVDTLIWDSQKFLTEDSELLVLCSTNYDINDYIFDFEEFNKIKTNEKIISNRR